MGVKSKKKAKTRLDAYYRLAKDQGYRARSAFKLIQLNRKYDFLSKSRVLVDLCAAPGGWCQVAAQFMPVGSKIIGVDLVPIAPIRGVKTFVGDITDDKTRKTIKTWLKKEPVDCVIHDGAPNVGGVWAKDLFAQNALVLSAAKMACDLLRPGGWFVTKVFRSPDYQKLFWVLKQVFEKVEATKPLASRMESAEIFVTCTGFKAPRQLDPRLFQAQYAFEDVGEEKHMLPNGMMVHQKTNVPQGYEEFATIPTRVCSITDFLDSQDPKALLQTQHEIRFVTDEEKALLKSRWCKPELVFLMYDLQQVGEADRKRLLRLRDQLLRERAARLAKIPGSDAAAAATAAAPMSSSSSAAAKAGVSDDDDDDIEELEIDEDAELDDMARQLLAQKRAEEKERKKKQKKLIDRKLKKVRGLINFDPNDASANAPDVYEGAGSSSRGRRGGNDDGDDDDYYDDDDDGDYDAVDDETREFDNKHGLAIQRLSRHSDADLARAFDEDAIDLIDSGRGARLPNIPLNAINDVHLDPDDDMNNAGALDEGAEEEFDPNSVLLDPTEGELDVDNEGNYIRADVPVSTEKFRVGKSFEEQELEAQLKEDAAVKEQRKRDKREAKLEEVGKQSKWERRHLNVEQVLRETFAKPKQQSADKRKKSRTEEELIEMGEDVAVGGRGRGSLAAASSSSSAAGGKAAAAAVSKEERRRILANKLHDESDDDDDGILSDDDDDDDSIGSMQAAYSDEDRDDAADDDGDDDAKARAMSRKMLRPGMTKAGTAKLLPDMGKLTAQEQAKALRKQLEKDNKKAKKGKKAQQPKKAGKKDGAFEEIPVAMADPTIRARTLALATKMLDKRQRNDILEGGVHRYMNNDDEDLPDWFVEDEQMHYQLNLPVTAEEMEAQRQRFQELNSRPSKRVMEAVGRKRRKAQRMLRSMIEKGKTDPMVRNKVANTSVRKLMRSRTVRGGGAGAASGGKKKGPIDNKKKGEMRRTKQAMSKHKKGKKGGRR